MLLKLLWFWFFQGVWLSSTLQQYLGRQQYLVMFTIICYIYVFISLYIFNVIFLYLHIKHMKRDMASSFFSYLQTYNDLFYTVYLFMLFLDVDALLGCWCSTSVSQVLQNSLLRCCRCLRGMKIIPYYYNFIGWLYLWIQDIWGFQYRWSL